MVYLRELLAQVVSSLLRNKLRSFLTMAGIAWGVASIVLIVAMGDGFKQGQRNNIKQLGENIVHRLPRPHREAGGRAARRPAHPAHVRRRPRHPHRMLPGAAASLPNCRTAPSVVSPFNSGSFHA